MLNHILLFLTLGVGAPAPIDEAVTLFEEGRVQYDSADYNGAIVEKGGKLAHFAIVTRGRGITVMRHPEACELFTDGMRVTLNPKTGRIVVEDS